MTQLAASGSRYSAITLYIERPTKFPCCAGPASCLTCGNADKRNELQDEELGTPLICQKPTMGGLQHYLSSVLAFLLQNISIFSSWFLKRIWAPLVKRCCLWTFSSLPSTEGIGSNTPSASCGVLCRDSKMNLPTISMFSPASWSKLS